MRRGLIAALTAALMSLPLLPSQAAMCTGHGVELQVLGSGGPELLTARASSSYLIRRDGRPSVLVDSGGGSALRFAEAGARVADLDAIVFSHFHVDHAGDFAALIKSSYFQDRRRPLPVFGPAGNTDFPGMVAYSHSLFAEPNGAFHYLSDFLPPAGKSADDAYALRPQDVQPPAGALLTVYETTGLKLAAATVVHGRVPALGWRVEVDGAVLAFSGDTNGDNGNLEKVAAGADLFVAHNAVPEGVRGPVRGLHMPPSVIGRVAADAAVHRLVLSHRMSRTLGREADTTAEIRKHYEGPLAFADDLDCYSLTGEP